ncbi:hypothetical protein TNCV_1254981 [Trichonephila clavipes]|nr:hypothetical protein TNCV_1254981 [Trichonephila clavipes]
MDRRASDNSEKLGVDDGRCINVGFVNSSTTDTPWTACKDSFIQDPPSGQTIDGCVCNGHMRKDGVHMPIWWAD